jgi:hypothetical protein
MPESDPGATSADTIGQWTTNQLIKFVQDTLRNDPPALPSQAQTDELTVNRKLTITDELFVANQQLFHVVGKPGEPVFKNTWANHAGGYQPVGFWIDALGVVHLRGMLASGTVNSPAFTLPPGFRPVAPEPFPTVSNLGATRIDITANGDVTPVTGSGNTFVALSGISFKTVT